MAEFNYRFFIALIPNPEIQQYANHIKQHFAEVYNSSGAQQSPPHITLQPPFRWQEDNLPLLQQNLKEFAQTKVPIPIKFSNFGAFPPKVIFINVLKTPELLQIKQDLQIHLKRSLGIVHKEPRNRQFNPHLTVAFRDLSKQNFSLAWQKYQHQELNFNCIISQLTLLIHKGGKWEINQEFPLLNNNQSISN